MLLVFKTTHLYNHQNQKMGGSQKLCFSKKTFFCVCVSCHFGHFPPFFNRTTHVISRPPKHGQVYIFYTFHFFSLRPHPPRIQKGGHTTHAYSFSYWATPISGPKGGGGGMCLKCPPPPPPPPPPLHPPMHCKYFFGINFK